MLKFSSLRNQLAALGAALIVSLGATSTANASVVMTWEEIGGSLNLSIKGTWSDWDATTIMTERDDLLFQGNGNTSVAIDLSRDGLGTTAASGLPNGAFALLNVVSGSGNVTGPDFSFAPVTGTRYNIEWLNVGGSLALSAGIITSETFSVDETFSLGAGYSLTEGTRVFGNSSFPGGDTLTMNFIAGQVPTVPLPAGGLLLLSAFGGIAALKRRKSRAA